MSLYANGKLFDLCLILFDKILTFLSPFCYQQKNNSVRENRDKVIDMNQTFNSIEYKYQISIKTQTKIIKFLLGAYSTFRMIGMISSYKTIQLCLFVVYLYQEFEYLLTMHNR